MNINIVIMVTTIVIILIASITTVSVLRMDTTDIEIGNPTIQPTSQPPTTQKPTPCTDFTFKYENMPPIVKYDENGIQRTPVMGWNTYFLLERGWTGDVLVNIAKEFIRLGYFAAGYDHINKDGGWWEGSDWSGPLPPPPGATTKIVKNIGDIIRWKSGPFQGGTRPNAIKFPLGVKHTADQIRALGFNFGTYHNIGSNWCNQQIPSGWGVHEQDVRQFVSWNTTFAKLDNCGVWKEPVRADSRCAPPYQNDKWCAALNAYVREFQKTEAGRKVRILNCRLGCQGIEDIKDNDRCDYRRGLNDNQRWRSYWFQPKFAQSASWCNMTHMSRTTSDTRACFANLIVAVNAGLSSVDNMMNDFDQILIGMNKQMFEASDPAKYGLDEFESRTNMALFCIMSGPLLVATNISSLPAYHTSLLLNKWAIYVDQYISTDSRIPYKYRLGYRLQPSQIHDWRAQSSNSVSVYWKLLGDDMNAFVICNQHNSQPRSLTFNITDFIIKGNQYITNNEAKRKTGFAYSVLNVFEDTQTTVFGHTFQIDNLASHDSMMIITRPFVQNCF